MGKKYEGEPSSMNASPSGQGQNPAGSSIAEGERDVQAGLGPWTRITPIDANFTAGAARRWRTSARTATGARCTARESAQMRHGGAACDPPGPPNFDS